jgi:capsular polysaccharide biosynthesis protein
VLSFAEQVAVDLATDVMVGPHGAGLMHNVFMRDRAVLVELFVDGSSYKSKTAPLPSDANMSSQNGNNGNS